MQHNKSLVSQLHGRVIRWLSRMNQRERALPRPNSIPETNGLEAKNYVPVGTPTDLDDLLHPMTSDVFFKKAWDSSVMYVPGQRGKFRELMPWLDLNKILEEHELCPPRLRMAKGGSMLDPKDYMFVRVASANIVRQMAEGATLIIDDIERCHRPLRDLIENMERLFRCEINVNLYATFREIRGFNAHHDDHDTMILQVAGRKHWKVYTPPHLYPTSPVTYTKTANLSNVVWNGILNDGDLLYVPRGYPHLVTPLVEPTLHLTVAFGRHTGIDLIRWLEQRLAQLDPEMRRSIPQFASDASQKEWIQHIRQLLIASINDGVIERYFATVVETIPSRIEFDLLSMVAGELGDLSKLSQSH